MSGRSALLKFGESVSQKWSFEAHHSWCCSHGDKKQKHHSQHEQCRVFTDHGFLFNVCVWIVATSLGCLAFAAPTGVSQAWSVCLFSPFHLLGKKHKQTCRILWHDGIEETIDVQFYTIAQERGKWGSSSSSFYCNHYKILSGVMLGGLYM